jgi:hypothetical protein
VSPWSPVSSRVEAITPRASDADQTSRKQTNRRRRRFGGWRATPKPQRAAGVKVLKTEWSLPITALVSPYLCSAPCSAVSVSALSTRAAHSGRVDGRVGSVYERCRHQVKSSQVKSSHTRSDGRWRRGARRCSRIYSRTHSAHATVRRGYWCSGECVCCVGRCCRTRAPGRGSGRTRVRRCLQARRRGRAGSAPVNRAWA